MQASHRGFIEITADEVLTKKFSVPTFASTEQAVEWGSHRHSVPGLSKRSTP
jgi:hypothetical protein